MTIDTATAGYIVWLFITKKMAQHADLKLFELLTSKFFFYVTRKWPLKYLFSLVEHCREGEQTDGNSVIELLKQRDYCHFPSRLSSYGQLAKVTMACESWGDPLSLVYSWWSAQACQSDPRWSYVTWPGAKHAPHLPRHRPRPLKPAYWLLFGRLAPTASAVINRPVAISPLAQTTSHAPTGRQHIPGSPSVTLFVINHFCTLAEERPVCRWMLQMSEIAAGATWALGPHAVTFLALVYSL